MSELNEQLRAEFEAWLGRPMMNPTHPSHYNGRDVRTAWEAWQAARAMPAPQAAPSGLTETQQYRTGYGEALRKAAVLCDAKYQARTESDHPREASTARALAEEIRSLQSMAPVVTQAAPSEPVAAQFKMPGETWEECGIDEEEVMRKHGYKFRYLYDHAAPVAAPQAQADAKDAECIADVIETLIGNLVLDWRPQGDDDSFGSKEDERAELVAQVRAALAAATQSTGER